MNNSRLVYSTESGRICPQCGKAAARCQCKTQGRRSGNRGGADGTIRLGREVKGRKGKCVTTITGFDGDAGTLKETAARLKRLCGSGGSVKSGVIIIQGDHRDILKAELKRQGFHVKLAGG